MTPARRRGWSCFMPERGLEEIGEILRSEAASILSVDRATIALDSPFQSLGMNSLGFVELLVVIEKRFNLKLMETDLSRDDFQTIGSLAERISKMK
jgi:acyl carrier protein